MVIVCLVQGCRDIRWTSRSVFVNLAVIKGGESVFVSIGLSFPEVILWFSQYMVGIVAFGHRTGDVVLQSPC